MTNLTTETSIKAQMIQKAWEDPEFLARLLNDPKSTLHDTFGLEMPEHIRLTAVQESADHFYLVIPPHPSSIVPKAEKVSIEPAAMWGSGT
ncbi:NHLP leader peptide family RiPP precursor [Saccharibacillus sp. JS10]|uniref:NHLP leader peptide family RiPP precursor n=1 Tax=Saccharibacillus sp. JS10 TaxID=2950552 RepID=UPI00210A61B0|nr:NHLP leader peptide family RiPP precursor [Saccharibacillus sp. JS10]MCQ4086621.1 NHLP leader peptide family RiPP precursor [Saccharibacillus sp. JS10]